MKLIPLTQGKFAQVDDDDFEELNKFKWYAKKNRDNTFYAIRGVFNGKNTSHIYLHREIMKTPKELVVDHIDHNGLNCQKYNMRNCTVDENRMNRSKQKGSVSKYLGVSLLKTRKKNKIYHYWISAISINGKSVYLGSFKTENLAAFSYNAAAVKHRGEFANLNKVS